AFGEDQETGAAIESRNSLAQLGSFAAEGPRFDADRVGDVLDKPAQDRQIVENAGHHGCRQAPQRFGDPDRIEPRRMIGADNHRTAPGKQIERTVNANTIEGPNNHPRNNLQGFAEQVTPGNQGPQAGNDSDEQELPQRRYQGTSANQHDNQERKKRDA